MCDEVCNAVQWDLDGGDCVMPPPLKSTGSDKRCFSAELHKQKDRCEGLGGRCVTSEGECVNGTLKGACGDDCSCCVPGCPPWMRNDGECDSHCNQKQFDFDGDDCHADPIFSACPEGWRGNGKCDQECNNKQSGE